MNEDLSKVKTKLTEVTPAYAKKILDQTEASITAGTFRQRPVSQPAVDRYARDIQLGAWAASPQTVSIDENGNCTDGRHRLFAIMQAGVPAMVNLSTGWPVVQELAIGETSTIDTIDGGKPRSLGQRLVIGHGFKHGNYFAAVSKIIANICCDAEKGASPSLPQTRLILEMYKNSADILFAIPSSPSKKVAYLLGPMAFHHVHSPRKTEEFAIKLFSMEGLTRGSPALTLIKWLENHKLQTSSLRLDVAKVVFSCLKAFESDQSISKVYASQEAWNWATSKQKENVRKVRQIMGVK